MKKVLMWVLTGFMLIIALAYFPSVCSILLFCFVLVSIPIDVIQEVWRTVKIKGVIKGVLLIVLFFAAVGTSPTNKPDQKRVDEPRKNEKSTSILSDNNKKQEYNNSPTSTAKIDKEPAEQQEVESSIIEEANDLLTSQAEELNGRGWSDSGREEPQYEGITGYVVIDYIDYNLQKTDECFETPWKVPVYEKDKQFYVECGTVDHKTEVIVKSQELKHEGHGAYSGYLFVEKTGTKETIYIDVGNFITKSYWDYEVGVAASIGYYIAEFNQTSDYYPVDSSNKKVDIEDGIKVLVTGRTGLYGRNGPSSSIHPIEAKVFKDWKYGYGGVSVFFNESDLKISY